MLSDIEQILVNCVLRCWDIDQIKVYSVPSDRVQIQVYSVPRDIVQMQVYSVLR